MKTHIERGVSKAMEHRRPFRQALRTVLINLVVVAGLLGVLEAGVRLAFPEIGPTGTDRRLFADSVYGATPGLRPGAGGESNGARFRVDERGFWAYDAPATDRPGWLFLGDSVTMGAGVPPDATFAGLTAARQDTLAVLNPALIGYASRDYVRVLRALLAHPDLSLRRVTVFWCLNDVYVPATADPGTAVRQTGGRLLTFLRLHARSYHWLKALFFDRPRAYFEHNRRLYEGAPLEAALADLAAMRELARTHGLRFDMVVLPYAYQLRHADTPGIFHPQDVLKARLRDFPVYDPAPFLHDHAPDPDALYLYGDGIHFSERGHALLAEYLSSAPGLSGTD